MRITKASENIIPLIGELHLNSFDRNHFTSRFDRELLGKYLKLLIADNKYCYTAFEDGQNRLTGYIICGDKSNEAVNKFIKNNFLKVAILLLKNPSFIIEKANEVFARLNPFGLKKSIAKMRVFIIAIDQNSQGKGTGNLLLGELESDLKRNKIKNYGLSVRKGNRQAINFYEKNHFQIEYENKKSIFYIKNIS